MATSDPDTIAKGHDVTNSVKPSNDAENKQEEQAAQTIQVNLPSYTSDYIALIYL